MAVSPCGRSFFLPSTAFVESRITEGRDVKPRHIASATVLEVVVTFSASLHKVSQLWDPNVRLVTQRSSVDHPWFSIRFALMCLPSTPQRALLHPILLQEPVHRHFTSLPSFIQANPSAHTIAQQGYHCAIALHKVRRRTPSEKCLRVNTSSRGHRRRASSCSPVQALAQDQPQVSTGSSTGEAGTWVGLASGKEAACLRSRDLLLDQVRKPSASRQQPAFRCETASRRPRRSCEV